MVPGMQNDVRHRLVVHKRSIGAGEIENVVLAVLKPELGVPAGDFRIVQPKLIASVPPHGVHRLDQVELLSFICTFDDNQTGHRYCLRGAVDRRREFVSFGSFNREPTASAIPVPFGGRTSPLAPG